MKQLFAIDLKDYEEGDRVFRRPSARGIIMKKDKIALVYSRKEHYYKFPGGGIKDNEEQEQALIREVKEEVGLQVIPDSITPFGSVLRRQKSNCAPDTVFEQENFYYFCETEDRVTPQQLDDYEQEAEFVLRFVSLDEAIETNRKYQSDDEFDVIMIERERKVLQMVKDFLQ